MFRFLSWKQYIAGFLKLHSESYSVLIGEFNVYIYCEYMCMCFCIHTHTYTCIFIVYHILYSYAFYTCLPPFFWSVQFSHSVVYDFATPAACPASLSITNSQSCQTHVHRLSDAIQPSHPLLFPSPPTFNLSQHQGLSQ